MEGEKKEKFRKRPAKPLKRRATGDLTPQRAPRVLKSNSDSDAENPSGPKSFPSNTMSTVEKRWESQDLDLLRSGLFADAIIICSEVDNPARKVHRNILAGRSDWFKKTFSYPGLDNEFEVVLDQSAWQVDLILYFFYSGGIDLADNALTGGRSVMDISIELLRLGNFFESKSMQDYGKKLLASYLGELMDNFCDMSLTSHQKKNRFDEQAAFPAHFCSSVRNAYCSMRPVKQAQGILADFAFAARIHMFENKEFVELIESKEVPEFGNLVLNAQIKGGISGAFNDNSTFEKLQDWLFLP